ncbi:MAG: 30S ribosomal protein S1 [Proteobacteria bacterium]|nr:30S ribosomal protein S1 [Pseudomonadota bacterium]
MAKSSAAENFVFSTGENFAELLEQTNVNKEGTVVKGNIINIDKDFVIVDIGGKTEGRIQYREFVRLGEPEEIKVGDEIDVFIERLENRQGEAVLSREKALREESWVKYEQAHTKGESVEGVIFSRVKGGFTVDLGGAVAFLPGSQVDVRPVKDVSPLMGIRQPFQILKMDRKRGNIVVSRRAILEESRSAERDEVLSKISQGQVLKGTVKNITDYGAFIDLGSVDGLLHVTDISWKRINHPSEVLSLGQQIDVKVIKFDENTKRISLGMKQLEDSPWQGVETQFPVGSRHKGRVTNIADYGAFVELAPGIEGLVHVSEMSWTKKNVHPSKIVSTSQEVEVVVLDIDMNKHRISLGMKQCEDNPWANFGTKYPEGTKITGEVKNVADFGIFVGLPEGVDGLVHVSDVAWNNPDAEIKNYTKGQQVEVVVLGVEPDKERVSLGLKQLTEGGPAQGSANAGGSSDVLGGLTRNGVSTFTVSAVKDDGIEVTVADGISAFIKRADLSSDRVEQRPERFAVGDRVDAKVISVNKAARKVVLSIKALELEEQKRAVAEYGSTDSGASLGDILGKALDKSKEKKSKAKKDDTDAEGETKAKKKK